MFEYLNAVTENIRENSCGLFNYRGVGDYVDYPVLALANRVFKREFQAAKSFSASRGHLQKADIGTVVKVFKRLFLEFGTRSLYGSIRGELRKFFVYAVKSLNKISAHAAFYVRLTEMLGVEKICVSQA